MFRVLVVDDDEIVRETMCQLLRDAGMTTFELPSAIGVSSTIRKEAIDAVLLDIHMPRVEGNKVVKMLRENPSFDSVATLLVSEMPTEELLQLGELAGAEGVISKNNLRLELVPAVRRAVRTFQHQTARRSS